MDNKKIGRFIATQRKQLSMTQQQLADKLNMTNRAVSKWETGEGYPDICVLPALAEILDVTADELLKEERAPEKQSGHAYRIQNTKEQAAYLLENSIRRFSHYYLVSMGIVLLGIIASFLSFKLYNGVLFSLGYALLISLSFLIIGILFYKNACRYLKASINKYNSMLGYEKTDYHKVIAKKSILFYAVYLVQVIIAVCVVPVFPFLSMGYHWVFHKIIGYTSQGRLKIDFTYYMAFCLALYCIALITEIVFIKRKPGTTK